MSEEWACEDCAWTCKSSKALELHRERSAACRIIRAKNLLKERKRQRLSSPDPPEVEDRPLPDVHAVDDDPPDNFHVLEDAEPPEPVTLQADPQAPGDEANARQRIFDSCEQVAAFIKRNKLSGTQTDELLKLWADDRLRLREVVSTFQSHRDVDRYLLASIVGETAKQVNLQRPGVDPCPVLLTYKPALDLIKELCANTRAAQDGFTVKPVIRQVKTRRREADGTIVEEVHDVDVQYSHPNTGTWWARAQAEIDADPVYEGAHIIIPIIVHIDKTTLDGLRKYSAFPVYISIANYSWKTYNEQGGMVLVALLPQPEADPDWPGAGYKPDSEGFRGTKRFFMHGALGIVFESARAASYTGFEFVDPFGDKRKGVPLLYAISKDLGEASSISGVRSNCCDSCLVGRKELNKVLEALAGEYTVRTEADMCPKIMEIMDLQDAGAPQVRITEQCQEYGVHPVTPWFFDWKYGNEDWNSPYLKMAPDDLHSVYGGVLGAHLPQMMRALGELLPMGATKLLETLDCRLHRIYTHHKPGHLRLPASPTFFTNRYPTPNYEWKALLQVLPALVAGLFRCGGRDVLVEWAVVLCDWAEAQFYPDDDAHTDASLARADELLLAFEAKCVSIAGLQSSRWNFRKFHELALFSRNVKILGSHRWYSTERGERQHHWVKIWWEMMNGRDVERGLHRQWTMALALEQIESQRAALQQLKSCRGEPYDSAITQALDDSENAFGFNFKLVVLWTDLLVDPANPQWSVRATSHEHAKQVLQLLRAQPLLSELPVTLGTVLGREKGLNSGSFDPVEYLRANFAPRLNIYVSAYIVPHEGGRKALHALRAWPDYFGRPAYSDLGIQGNSGDKWVGHALLFFSVGKLTTKWCEETLRRISAVEWSDYVFVRWYTKTGYRDAVTCDIYEWDTVRARNRGEEPAPSVGVVPLESVLALEQMLPKTTATRNRTQFYLNKYLR